MKDKNYNESYQAVAGLNRKKLIYGFYLGTKPFIYSNSFFSIFYNSFQLSPNDFHMFRIKLLDLNTNSTILHITLTCFKIGFPIKFVGKFEAFGPDPRFLFARTHPASIQRQNGTHQSGRKWTRRNNFLTPSLLPPSCYNPTPPPRTSSLISTPSSQPLLKF